MACTPITACKGQASHPGGATIFLAASCYGNRDVPVCANVYLLPIKRTSRGLSHRSNHGLTERVFTCGFFMRTSNILSKQLECEKNLKPSLVYFVRGAVVWWLARWTLDRAVWVRALAGVIVLSVTWERKTLYSHCSPLHLG